MRSVVTNKVASPWHEARGELAFLDVPREELYELRPRGVVRASAGWMAMTITGATAG